MIRTSDELAGRRRPREVDGLVRARAPAQHGRVGAARPLDEHLLHRPAQRGVARRGVVLDTLDQALDALLLDRIGHLVVHAGGVGAAARRVDERECVVVPDLVDERERLRELGLRLAGEADDDVGRERDRRDRGPDALDQLEVALARVRAPHGLEHAGRSGLDGQMQVLAHRRRLGHGRDHVGAHVLGMRAREADPVDAWHRVERAQECGEARRDGRAQVTAVGVHVLAEQRQLAHAVGRERRRLAHEVVRVAAVLAAAHARDDAVGAVAVAAGRDLQPRLVGAVALERQLAGEAVERREVAARDLAARLDEVAQAMDVARPERQVDERELLEELVLHRLRPAPSHDDHLAGVALLGGAGVHQVGDEAVVGLLADRAGVEDEEVGVGRRRRLAEPDGLEQALDPLGVVHVHLAAERRDVVAPHAAELYRRAPGAAAIVTRR